MAHLKYINLSNFIFFIIKSEHIEYLASLTLFEVTPDTQNIITIKILQWRMNFKSQINDGIALQ